MVSLCDTLVKQSIKTWDWMRKSIETGISLSEESITDLNLIEIQDRHNDQVITDKCSKPKENEIGADWEWWIYSTNEWLGLRVQAKRLYPDSLEYAQLDEKNGSQRQIDRLIEHSKADKMIPVYVFYNFWSVAFPRNVLMEYLSRMGVYGCYRKERIGNLTALFGCSMSNAYYVRRVLDGSASKSIVKLIRYGYYYPWSCMTCCNERMGKAGTLPRRFADLLQSNQRDLGIENMEPPIREKPPWYVSKLLEGKRLSEADWSDIKISRVTVITEKQRHGSY